jgi:hypothetical protein
VFDESGTRPALQEPAQGPMADDHIRYDILAQDALRGVVRKVLAEVAKTGLPGDHHFYITFATQAPGVRISSRLLADYPEVMTIVLQHRYWDLSVNEHAFEVGLSFNGVSERLLVPFTALQGFFDPSVQFALQFQTPGVPGVAGQPATEQEPASLPPAIVEAAAALTGIDDNGDGPEPGKAAGKPDAKADVVSLDAFRKKN